MKRWLVEGLAVLFLGIAGGGCLHQRLCTSDGWFNWGQVRHHESLVLIFLVAGVALLLGKYIGRIKGGSNHETRY